MSDLTPLVTLYDVSDGAEAPLSAELATLYGPLRLLRRADRPVILGNFVTTLDGVVSLSIPGQAGGREISGSNPHDRLIMGVLRAVVDAVIVGAGTLRASPRHLWIAEHLSRPLADAYRAVRSSLNKAQPPLNVIVTTHGEIDLGLPVFQAGYIPVLIVTTQAGEGRIRSQAVPPHVQIAALTEAGPISAQAILQAVQATQACETILTEGGPQLMGDFFAEDLLDELFLTLAPQVAGRDQSLDRPGLVAGKLFAPDHPIWGKLMSLKRGGDHLFLRYAFGAGVDA
jgi:riboflavin biosynthesis pyrimidine reductase